MRARKAYGGQRLAPSGPVPVLSCPVLSCPAVPCPVLPCPVLPCPVLPCPALSWPVLPCPVCPVASRTSPALSCPVSVRPYLRPVPASVPRRSSEADNILTVAAIELADGVGIIKSGAASARRATPCAVAPFDFSCVVVLRCVAVTMDEWVWGGCQANRPQHAHGGPAGRCGPQRVRGV